MAETPLQSTPTTGTGAGSLLRQISASLAVISVVLLGQCANQCDDCQLCVKAKPVYVADSHTLGQGGLRDDFLSNDWCGTGGTTHFESIPNGTVYDACDIISKRSHFVINGDDPPVGCTQRVPHRQVPAGEAQPEWVWRSHTIDTNLSQIPAQRVSVTCTRTIYLFNYLSGGQA